MLEPLLQAHLEPRETKESVAFLRYADRTLDPKLQGFYQFPKGAPYTRINAGELYKVQKAPDHNEHLRRSKSYVANHFFSPRVVP